MIPFVSSSNLSFSHCLYVDGSSPCFSLTFSQSQASCPSSPCSRLAQTALFSFLKLFHSVYSAMTALLTFYSSSKLPGRTSDPSFFSCRLPPLSKYHTLPQIAYAKLYRVCPSYPIYCWHRIKVWNPKAQGPCLDSPCFYLPPT